MPDPASKLHWEDFAPGRVFEHGDLLVTREDIVAFASEFDPQPMHLDEEAARRSMLGGLAASGWHGCSMFMRLLAEAFVLRSASMGAPGVDEVKWLAPIRPGDRLTLRIEVTGTRPSNSRPDTGFVRITAALRNRSGAEVMTLKSSIMIRRREGAPA